MLSKAQAKEFERLVDTERYCQSNDMAEEAILDGVKLALAILDARTSLALRKQATEYIYHYGNWLEGLPGLPADVFEYCMVENFGDDYLPGEGRAYFALTPAQERTD